MKSPLSLILAILLPWFGSARADVASLRWDCKRVHFTPAEAPAYDAWVINPPEARSENAQTLAVALDTIFHEANPRIAHIQLADLIRRPELQADVMAYVAGQPEFQHYPPPTGFGRWEFKRSDQKRALIAQGLLHSRFVADCNALLAPHGKSIKSVSMEKLFFTKKDGQWGWDAMVWLMIDPPPVAVEQRGNR